MLRGERGEVVRHVGNGRGTGRGLRTLTVAWISFVKRSLFCASKGKGKGGGLPRKRERSKCKRDQKSKIKDQN